MERTEGRKLPAELAEIELSAKQAIMALPVSPGRRPDARSAP
jgi:hypothetical protein